MKLPLADTPVSYCWRCRYHGFETWCPFNLAKMASKGLVLGVAALAAAYGLFIEWSVKLLLVAIIAAVIYIALATVLDWQQVDPVMPLLSSIRK